MGFSKTSALGLPELRKRMAGLASESFRMRMSRNLAEEARTQVANGFREERDPYGRPWAPIHRAGQILQDTGRLRASCATRATAAGFRIDMPVVYAAVHQYGAKPHARKGGAIPQSRRGRFMSKRAAGKSRFKAQRVAVFGSYTHGGMPARQMIPMASTGGLGPIWTKAFNETANGLIARYSRGGS